MKPLTLAGIVGAVFLAGIGVGLVLQNDPPAQDGDEQAKAEAGEKTAESEAKTSEPREPELSEDPARGPGATNTQKTTLSSGGRRRPRQPNPWSGPDGTPPPPPPPSAKALEEGEAIKRELERTKGRGGGKVVPLVYPKDPAEARALEERRLKRWERRLAYANAIRIKELRKKVGLTANQEARLETILDGELAARQDLVRQHMAKKISNSTFDEQARKNREQAREQVKALLSAEQWKTYQGLKPREQVLRDDIK